MAGSSLAEELEVQIQKVAYKKPLTPSFPKASNGWGSSGSRLQGPNRALSMTDAKTNEEHIELSSKAPAFFPKMCAKP